jgi:glucuronokinase
VQPGCGRAFARAALAGNPSDGYGGQTLAVVVREFAAEAEVRPATADRLVAPGPGGEPLLRAALARFRASAGAPGPVDVRCVTTVPREVGLAGSSAIVMAVLRALSAATRVPLGQTALAEMALAVETEDLGIAAGMQDRLVQAHEALLAMDFGPGGGIEVLDPVLLPPLYLAWRPDAAAPSGRVHSALRERWARADPELRAAMARLAAHAATARDALLAGDADAFAACVDGSLEVRRRIMPVDDRVMRMAEVARAQGASANSAGSGGAIVGTLRDVDGWPALARALRATGCEVARPRTAH